MFDIIAYFIVSLRNCVWKKVANAECKHQTWIEVALQRWLVSEGGRFSSLHSYHV